MISLKNVTKYYYLKGGEKHYVMKDLTLDIPSGENIAILGRNGAGKSTLLRLIGGAESPNEGTITSDANISWPLGVGVGFQGSLTGRQNLEFVCKINGLSSKETTEASDFVLEFSELGKFYDNPVKTYSSGMRARLAFGLSIAFDFDYYLIDELTSVGDAIFREKASEAFKEIKKRATLIFVAHNIKMLQSVCDSAIYLHEGEATYYPNIIDGVKAYQSYINEEKAKNAENPQPAQPTRKPLDQETLPDKSKAEQAPTTPPKKESPPSNKPPVKETPKGQPASPSPKDNEAPQKKERPKEQPKPFINGAPQEEPKPKPSIKPSPSTKPSQQENQKGKPSLGERPAKGKAPQKVPNKKPQKKIASKRAAKKKAQPENIIKPEEHKSLLSTLDEIENSLKKMSLTSLPEELKDPSASTEKKKAVSRKNIARKQAKNKGLSNKGQNKIDKPPRKKKNS